MANVQTEIRIDAGLKKEAVALFNRLGLDMSSAVNMFLRQCIIYGGIPFEVRLPRFSKETEEAIKEAGQIENDPNHKTYGSVSALKEELDADTNDEEV